MERQPVELAINGAQPLLARLEAALAAGEIDEARWYREVAAVITPAYLAGDNPRAQSGHSGDERHWEQARSLIVDAIHRDGDFLDVGCASGYLMECLPRWAAARGRKIEPWGLDISSELAELARRRLPQWAERIVVGNAIEWRRARRFAFVRTGLEYVPAARGRDLVAHLLEAAIAPGGRLIVGVYNEERDETRPGASLAEAVAAWGFPIAGRAERAHYHDDRLVYRILWIDAAGGG